MSSRIVLLFLLQLISLSYPHLLENTCEIEERLRFDCYPEPDATPELCNNRGCCWQPALNDLNTPYCFYGANSVGYTVCGKNDTDTGFVLDLCLKKSGPYGSNIASLKAEFQFETDDRLHVKIYDPTERRYEVPIPVPDVTSKALSPNYLVTYTNELFGFKVTRLSNNETIFDSSVGGFIFSDQFLQISSLLPSENIYGLGEHVLGLKLKTNWNMLTLFSRDIDTPEGGVNLYGVHPFYINTEKSGWANGVFLKNSNAMDIILQPTPAITYRTIGGILDFYFFLGPTTNDVVSQYTDVVGRPTMPPFWSLGFHLCRWGYNSVDNTKKVRDRMAANYIPQDVQWNDIDYMDKYLDFTIGENFSGLSDFVGLLHEQGLHYVLMLDPAISNQQTGYPPYDIGVQKNIFVKNNKGENIIGEVWPGSTVFPDFFNPNVSSYWTDLISSFHKKISFDGLWIDMNEPSSFKDGSAQGCPQNSFENPPYTPAVIGDKLSQKTLCMSAQQHIGIHYNLHSLYGHSEANVTMNALQQILGKRSLVISRSTYAGTGSHAGHWLGDNHSTWKDLYSSIAGIINFNLFGIPLVGADICGFSGDTTEELCSRWMQLGAFYPFSRNHNDINSIDQDPAAFGQMLIVSSRNALNARYRLLPYLYTLFFEAHVNGTPVARALFSEFPQDINCIEIDKQFMLGNGLLISPVLEQGVTSINAYFPKGLWYNFNTGEKLVSSGQFVGLPASFETVNLHIQGGIIIPTQEPEVTTTKSRLNDFEVLVAFNKDNEAEGSLFVDDGETFIDVDMKNILFVEFTCSQKSGFHSIPLHNGYNPPNPKFSKLIVLGLSVQPLNVYVNGNSVPFEYDFKMQILEVTGMSLSITKENFITWDV
ncbi:lysosomal alpha-glucosidase isoform X1 [Hydra vulgaris]|uniref:lysosomal alpha-glucosidase isoform X1 n=1 Tax=Hydra vulgaris TaxID=6087 RepID=UPI001F5EB1D2|nr:lysosomal alpha-glucosidase-like isoform X1 [Hydra vulgaris]